MSDDQGPLRRLVEPLTGSPEPPLCPPGALEIMRSYVERTEDLFVLPDIPGRVLRRVAKRLWLPEWEELLAILDTTVIGDGRTFMAFTTAGLHIQERMSSEPPFQPWDRILRHRADPTMRDGDRIRIGDHVYWPAGSGADLVQIAAMIDELGGWASTLYESSLYDAPVPTESGDEAITTVVQAESIDELIESVYVFTFGLSSIQVAPTIERSLAGPLRSDHKIAANLTILAVPEFTNDGAFALTERGLVGIEAGKGTTLKKSWKQVRDHHGPLVLTSDNTLEVGGGVFDLSSVLADHDPLLELIRFVSLRVPHI